MKKRKIPSDAITERELRRLIKSTIKDSGDTRSEWASEKGITAQSLSSFLLKKQGPGYKIPRTVGYKPLVIYVPIEEDAE